MPELAHTVAMVLLLLLHDPPPIELLRVIVLPAHTEEPPVIVPGNGFTVIAAVS
jgi:hypothetical protein